MNSEKAFEAFLGGENHYVYQRRWRTTRKSTKHNSDGQTTHDSEEEYGEEQHINTACSKLKERLHARNRKVKHSTHRHPLLCYKMLMEDRAVCTICEIGIIGLGYGCDQDCEFLIHKSCLHTPTKIRHTSHPDHPLTLLSSPVYVSGSMICNACRDSGDGYHYHCPACNFDVHVACAGLPEMVHCPKHRYPLHLYCRNPIEKSPTEKKETTVCDVCQETIILKGWIYYNRDSKFVAHLDCGFSEGIEESISGIEDRLLHLKVAA